MGSTLSVTHLRGLTSGSNANEILIDSGHEIVGISDGSFRTLGEINIIASGYKGSRATTTYASTEETILSDTTYSTKFPKRKYMIFLGYSFYKSTGGQVRFRFRVGGSQTEIINYKNVTSDHDNVAHTFITTSTYTTDQAIGIRIRHNGTTQVNLDDSYTWWVAEIAA